MCHHPDYGCERRIQQAPQHGWHHPWGCCCVSGYAPRRFPTREELIAEMEEYLKQLHAEVKGVEEHLAELKK